jgi:hypothetical protein
MKNERSCVFNFKTGCNDVCGTLVSLCLTCWLNKGEETNVCFLYSSCLELKVIFGLTSFLCAQNFISTQCPVDGAIATSLGVQH